MYKIMECKSKLDIIDNEIVKIDAIKEKSLLEKYANYYFLLDFWMKNIEQGKKISNFFRNRAYKTVAIYGMASLGEHFKCQIESDISILYTIDREIVTYRGKQYSMKESIQKLPKPDVVVITPVMEYTNIKQKISAFICTDIVSLEEVVLSL